MTRCLLFAGLLWAVAGAAGLGSGQALAAGRYFVQIASVKSDAGARKE